MNFSARALFLAALFEASFAASATGRVDVTTFVGASGMAAKCDGLHDDHTQLADALSAAIASKSALYIPAGAVCLTSTTLNVTRLVSIIGDGPAVSHLIYTGTGNAIAVIPPVTSGTCLNASGSIQENIGHVISGINISPSYKLQSGTQVGADGTGQNGIWVYLQCTAPYAYFDYSDIRIGPFGGLGLLLDNSAGNANGFYNGRIANSLIFSGINAINIGDSITFDKVTATGSHNVTLSGGPAVAGARQVSWNGGQISTNNGALALTNVHGFRANNVWIEEQGNCTSSCTTAAISIVDSWDAYFNGLTFNVSANSSLTSVFALYGAKDTKIINNNFTNRGTSYHIYGGSSGAGVTSRTRIEGNNYYVSGDTQLFAPVISFQSGSN